MSGENEYLLKICIIGASKYKTQLVRVYAEGKFTTNYMPTLGVDITTKKIQIGNNRVKLILVDTAGQEFFGKLRPSYYRGASACLIIFALNEKKTFALSWLAEFRKHIPDASIPIALIGIEEPRTEEIRTEEIRTKEPRITEIGYVRKFIRQIQRILGKKQGKKHPKAKAIELIPVDIADVQVFTKKHNIPYYEITLTDKKSQVEYILTELAKKALTAQGASMDQES